MGWIEKVKSIICGLKASGKSEKEIEQIVQQAADKATVGGKMEVKPIPPLFGNEYMKQARMGMLTSFGIPAPLLGGQYRGMPEFSSALQPILPINLNFVPSDGFVDGNMTDRWIWFNGMNVVANGYGIKAQDAVDAFTYAVAAQARYKARTESNNWRKMHGLPMRRKRRVRR